MLSTRGEKSTRSSATSRYMGSSAAMHSSIVRSRSISALLRMSIRLEFSTTMARGFEDHCWKDVVSAETLAIYRAYEREVFVGERPALLAIDLYNLVYEGGARPVRELINDHPSTCGEYAWAAIEPTKRLFAAARAAKLPIFYSTTDTSATVMATERRVNRVDERSWEIRADFAPRPGDVLVKKQRASVFYGTPLIAHLNKLGVRS